MARDHLGIWSPHRDSHSVLALKAALSLRPERWQWCERPEDASFWIVDAQFPLLGELTEQLKQAKQQGPVFAALLAAEWSALRDPVWTFLKVPLQVKVVYQWIDGCLQKHPVPSNLAPWQGYKLKLKRWPNMSHYTSSNPAVSIQITATCGKLLTDWMRYEDLCLEVVDASLLNALLADAQKRGILESVREEANSDMHATSLLVPTQASTEGAWSLIKRLIRKFA